MCNRQPKWKIGLSIQDKCNTEPVRQQNAPVLDILTCKPCPMIDHPAPCNCSTTKPTTQTSESMEVATKAEVLQSSSNQILDATLPREECETHWYPSGHWTRRSTEPAVKKSSERPGRQMYGSLTAQHAIWKKQHPSSCHDQKFIVLRSTGAGHGIGSALHMVGVVLQVALDLDRVLVMWPQPTGEWIQGPYCEGYPTLDSCYFEPLSSCTIYDALGEVGPSDESWQSLAWLDQSSYNSNSHKVRIVRRKLGTPLDFREGSHIS